jgi:hypothetical protein
VVSTATCNRWLPGLSSSGCLLAQAHQALLRGGSHRGCCLQPQLRTIQQPPPGPAAGRHPVSQHAHPSLSTCTFARRPDCQSLSTGVPTSSSQIPSALVSGPAIRTPPLSLHALSLSSSGSAKDLLSSAIKVGFNNQTAFLVRPPTARQTTGSG